jgi:ribosome biogenesis GTPase
VVAANVDRVFVVTSLPDDFNVRRLERYVAATWESGATPTIVLTKSDLVDDTADWIARAGASAPGVDVLAISTLTGDGITVLESLMSPGMTIAFLGSSGVGKSTLINRLAGQDIMRTADVRGDGRGRHTTTHRELIRLPNGVLVIDTPGMRELQLWAGSAGLEQTFEDISTLSGRCRFRDCTHEREPDCAVRAALESGTLLPERLVSWRKLSREAARTSRDALAAAEQQAKLRVIMRAVRKHTRDKYRGA